MNSDSLSLKVHCTTATHKVSVNDGESELTKYMTQTTDEFLEQAQVYFDSLSEDELARFVYEKEKKHAWYIDGERKLAYEILQEKCTHCSHGEATRTTEDFDGRSYESVEPCTWCTNLGRFEEDGFIKTQNEMFKKTFEMAYGKN